MDSDASFLGPFVPRKILRLGLSSYMSQYVYSQLPQVLTFGSYVPYYFSPSSHSDAYRKLPPALDSYLRDLIQLAPTGQKKSPTLEVQRVWLW